MRILCLLSSLLTVAALARMPEQLLHLADETYNSPAGDGIHGQV